VDEAGVVLCRIRGWDVCPGGGFAVCRAFSVNCLPFLDKFVVWTFSIRTLGLFYVGRE
jgi:hypothetical protein